MEFKSYFPQLVLIVLLVASNKLNAVEFVMIGDNANVADSNGWGAVAYNYRISTTEVTNADYVIFLNAVAAINGDPHELFEPGTENHFRTGITRSGSGTPSDPYIYSSKTNFSDRPVNMVSWNDAARYVNWLHNGQGNADTENGVYDFTSGSPPATHSINAVVWLPTDDEWYKAAHYTLDDGDGDPGYWVYQTQSDVLPIKAQADVLGDVINPGPNVANWGFLFNWNEGEGFGNVNRVKDTTANSYYGTFDQAGNVNEWIETLEGTSRVYRGGSFSTATVLLRTAATPDLEGTSIGFRVAGAIYQDGDLAPLGNPDGIINSADYLIAQRIVLGELKATQLELAHGDLYPAAAPDGSITISDLVLINELILQQP